MIFPGSDSGILSAASSRLTWQWKITTYHHYSSVNHLKCLGLNRLTTGYLCRCHWSNVTTARNHTATAAPFTGFLTEDLPSPAQWCYDAPNFPTQKHVVTFKQSSWTILEPFNQLCRQNFNICNAEHVSLSIFKASIYRSDRDANHYFWLSSFSMIKPSQASRHYYNQSTIINSSPLASRYINQAALEVEGSSAAWKWSFVPKSHARNGCFSK